MRSLLLVAVVVAFAIVPAMATLPVADACEPYSYYCPIDGQLHHACGTKVPSSCVMSILDP